ncbi:MAG: VCBS repeat-containing protein [Bacteroidota bacterium]|nr:VCBS repeat-containing protein [Bacteroidota bacterium]
MNIFKFNDIILFSIIIFISSGCGKKENTLFQLVSPDHSGIHFTNEIFENDTLNILNQEYIYNGGGIAVGDFNNDGLPDLYFTGNMVSNKLYLNNGNFIFEDITEIAGVSAENKWCSGVTVVDINQDGWLDIYVSVTLKKDSVSRKNLLYINKGLNENGIPTFKESAAKYGIDDVGHTTQAAFFDYDNDGDLDLYLLTNIIDTSVPTNYKKKNTSGTAINNDRLYRNNGDNTFTNVSMEAGILYEGFGLGITISDINMDGWPDIYIANDYISNDLLYINNQDGTFSNKIADYIKHQSYSSMGTDVVDINNDGLVDIIAVDMLPENNQRKKQMIGPSNYITYINNDLYGFEHQYVRNTLQLNRGISPKGHPTFSEIGQLSGVYQTDWSWTPLVADFDNDGYRDIIITNGFPKDVTDRDFATYVSGPAGLVASKMQLQDSIPIVKISNYAFRNNGDLTFTDKTTDWGLNIPSFSNGAVYVDLDNDGDLDIVINNINDKAFVYKNQTINNQDDSFNYIRINFEGTIPNSKGIGTKVFIHYNGIKQYFEQSLTRGYLSSIEDVAHFGIGNNEVIDSIQILWPDNKYQLLVNIPANQVLKIRQKDAVEIPSKDFYENQIVSESFLMKEVSKEHGIQFKHDEEDKIDFNLQRTLPHKYTQLGPGIAVADINGDGLEDFYVGGAAGKTGIFFIQDQEGNFINSLEPINPEGVKPEEDMGILFFDANNDGYPDLYIVSGSYEFSKGSEKLQDRLYINNGKGKFELDKKALPENFINGSCVKAADFDKDGFLDLFVGGRVVPGEYPLPAKSSILRNMNGKFTDVTSEVCPELQNLGMVTDAIWTDFDNDGQIDLIVVGEWMPVTFFKNENGKFKNITSSTGIASKKGWWNSIVAADFDNDGDIDYVVGNLGLNTNYKASEEQPLYVYAKDFDQNGSMDAILAMYLKSEEGEMKLFPMHSRDDLISQMVSFRKKFPKYKDYGNADMKDVLSSAELEGALIMEATHFASSYLENKGGGKFEIKELPIEAQFAPIFGMLAEDCDNDGNMDLLLVGNNYATEVFTGRHDAFTGLYLKNDGSGNFVPQPQYKIGFFVEGDAKGISKLHTGQGKELILVTQNQDSLKVFSQSNHTSKKILIKLQVNDARAELIYKNGIKTIKEFYYGSTYLSQSSRTLSIDESVVKVKIFDFVGNERTYEINDSKLISKHQ